jgi:hypothetical protein
LVTEGRDLKSAAVAVEIQKMGELVQCGAAIVHKSTDLPGDLQLEVRSVNLGDALAEWITVDHIEIARWRHRILGLFEYVKDYLTEDIDLVRLVQLGPVPGEETTLPTFHGFYEKSIPLSEFMRELEELKLPHHVLTERTTPQHGWWLVLRSKYEPEDTPL